jgi:HK97 family phage prohead protease
MPTQQLLDLGDHGGLERRFIVTETDDATVPLLSVETRAAKMDDGSEGEPEEWIVGYAARFGVESLNLGDFVERIDPGAFALVSERRGRKTPLMTRALFNHDPNFVLGRYPDTLRMSVDEIGLRYEVLPPASQRGVIESIKRGDIRGSSFAFVIAKGGETWHVEEGRHIRTVTAVSDLMDVGPVTYPAYPDSSVSVAQRSFEQYARESVRATEKRNAMIEKAKEWATIRAEHMEWLSKNGKR